MERSLNLFISYSHSDEEYVKNLKKHLITLKSKKILKEWHDRELVTGDKLNDEIINKLLQADLVAFIISIDFLNSFYCVEIELKETLKRVKNKEARIVPIIAEHCKWTDTELNNYVATPLDGKPLSTFQDPNEGWLQVIEAIEKAAEKYIQSSEATYDSAQIATEKTVLRKQFSNYLEDTEVIFSHRYKEQINLSDIFVPPDLKDLKQEYDRIEDVINSLQLINENHNKILILGSEQSGKTTLCKAIFKQTLGDSNLPLLKSAIDIHTTNIKTIIRSALSDQYSDLTDSDYLDSQNKKVLIIDDFEKVKINNRFIKKFIDAMEVKFDQIIIIASNMLRYDESKFLALSDYLHFEIMPFGNLRRGDLIDKWNSIGRVETIEIKELHNENDKITTHVNAIIRRNVLPPKPIYVLTIIQLLETSKPTDYTLTSYGHCYQSLIQSSLEKANIKPREFDLYINYLTELAYHIYSSENESIDFDSMSSFQEKYSKEYLIKSHEEIIRGLLHSGVLREKRDRYSFGYRYIFYFYVAKYLAENLNLQNCKKIIERICENLSTEKNANILIFLVHHSKDKQILDEILLHTSMVFDGTKEATLNDTETKHLLEYIATIPKLVIEQKNIEEERKKHLANKDRIEKFSELSEQDTEAEIAETTILSEINKSARAIEVIGQILRNRYGSLTRSQLKELAESAYSSGLRFLGYFLTSARNDQEYIIDYIKTLFEENTDLNDAQIADEARSIYLMFCYGTSFAVIRKIASSIGTDKLFQIFDEINTSSKGNPAMELVHVAMKLEFAKTIPKKEISDLFSDLKGNPIAQRLLQELVIQYLYLNYVDYQDRQWISEKLNLPIKTQRLLQSKAEYRS